MPLPDSNLDTGLFSFTRPSISKVLPKKVTLFLSLSSLFLYLKNRIVKMT